MAAVFHIAEHVVPAAHIREYARGTLHDQNEQLSIHVKQYTPRDNPAPRHGDVTVIGAHANGFPKEMYEPLWEDFYREALKRGVRIRSILICDVAWQGQSAALNEGKLGNDPGWLDASRDIAHMINTLRPPRPLVAMGHSLGAVALTNVALSHPRLFTTTVLLDPTICRFHAKPGSLTMLAGVASVNRRETWPSRAEAAASFGRSKFYRTWDPRVLDRWVAFGLVDTGKGDEVTLATSKHQEMFTFFRPSWNAFDEAGDKLLHPELVPDLDRQLNPHEWRAHPVYRPEGESTLHRLPNLRPSTLFIFGAKSNLSTPEMQAEKLALTGVGVGGSGGVAEGRVKAVVAQENGHLVPMEDPRLCAAHAADWVAVEMERWLKEEDEYEEWKQQPLEAKIQISDEYKRRMSQLGQPVQKAKI